MRILRASLGSFILGLNRAEALEAVCSLVGQLSGIGGGASSPPRIVWGAGLRAWLCLTLIDKESPPPDQEDPVTVVRGAVRALLRNRDFLGHQLSYANGNLSNADFEHIAAEYLAEKAVPDEVLGHRAAVIAEFFGDDLDSDVLSVMLECDGNKASQILQKLRGR